MLIDNVKRLDANGAIKLYNIDIYSRPAQIRSVPALMLLPGREIIYGKNVFDHLLLPSRGILVTGGSSSNSNAAPVTAAPVASGDPMGFSSSKAVTSSTFASLDDNANASVGPEAWAWMGEMPTVGLPASLPASQPAGPVSQKAGNSGPFGVETRDLSNKALPDMEAIMQSREHDLRIVT